jgi:hypothetical protein
MLPVAAAVLALVSLPTLLAGGLPPSPAPPRVLIWLYDCDDSTLQALVNHSDAFTAVAPSLYTVGGHANGSVATLASDASGCAEAIHRMLPGKEIWAWITSPDSLTTADEDGLILRTH